MSLRPTLCSIVLACLAGALSCSRDPAPAAAGSGKPGGAERTTPLVVGFSQVGAESAWRTAETKSIRDEAEKRGIELRFRDAQGRQTAQVEALRTFITQKVDAIVLAPIVSTGWDPVLRDAKAAGIPVILVDRGIETNDSTLFATLIASDFVEEGRMAARWLVERVRGDSMRNGICNIYELQGTVGAAPAIDRKKGFEEVIAQHKLFSIVKSQSADFERAKGKEVMEAFIRSAEGKMHAVYAHNDDMALGAIQALNDAGLAPGKEVLVLSIDGVKPAFDAMIAGTLNATVECNPLLGPIAFDTLERIRRGEEVPKFIKQQDRLFEAKDAAKDIVGRQY